MELDGHLAQVQRLAARAWYDASRDSRHPADLAPHWRAGTTETGEPLLTVQVTGQHAPKALHRFASYHLLVLGAVGDQRPGFEYRPGRVVCVWRRCGVWIEMWHPDIPAVPVPSPANMPKRAASLLPPGRLPARGITLIKEN